MTGDQYMQCEAMMHVEAALGLLDEIAMPEPNTGLAYLLAVGNKQQLQRRLWGALYLVQALNRGNRPENWHTVMDQAREYDAKAEAAEVVTLAKNGHYSRKD